MTDEDYEELGLRCGLEIHQQLLTDSKLFCRCPAGRYSDEYDAEILRHMRPTLSELGEYDGTALMEKKTKKNIYYRIHNDTVCTYEMDDTPPFLMDEKALDIALGVALLLRLNMVSELHIARKQYLDGSIPTGFQRTTIVGVDGWIPYKGRKIGIIQLGLEEDSCREGSDIGHERIYLTDRLGMPLIEPVTYPDMRTPLETAEVAEILRRLCRSTGKVRTGLGAGRQDVNVSIRGGTRIEIKGVPRISKIPDLIYNEARRQWSLLRIRSILKERGVTPESFESSHHDVTRLLADTVYDPIRQALNSGMRVWCTVLKKFEGLLKITTQRDTTFAKEFSDRVRVIACLTTLPNLIHSDAGTESLQSRKWQKLRRKVRATHEDTLVLVWGPEDDMVTACDEIALRAREATEGVPSDTRQALKDGTSGFERVLPGAERMYPDTDLPPLAITGERIERIRAGLPEYIWDREARYREMKLTPGMIGVLCQSPRAGLFERIVNELSVDPVFAAVILTERMKNLERRGLNPELLPDDTIFQIFRALSEGRLAREGVIRVLRRSLDHDGEEKEKVRLSVENALTEIAGEKVSEEDVSARIAAAILETASYPFAPVRQRKSTADNPVTAMARRNRHLMGLLMKELAGRVEGSRLAASLGTALENDGQ